MYGIGYWLTKHAEQHPQRVALVTPQKAFSYAELNREANRAAHALSALGLRAGDRIGVLCMNYPEFLALLFGAGKIGVVVVTLNYRLTAPELAFPISDSNVRVLFVGSEQTAMIPQLQELTRVEKIFALEGDAPAGCETYVSLVANQSDAEPAEPISWDAPLLTVYTSGTTGKPKGAVLTHANQFWNAMNDILALGLTANDITLTVLPLVHVGGIGLFTLPTLLMGGRVVMPRKFDAESAIELIERERVTIMMGVPAVWGALLASPRFAAADFSSVRFFYNGGDRCPLQVVRAFRARGLPFAGGYGLTETSPTATMMEAEDAERGTQRLGFIGKPAFFTEARVVNSDRQDVPRGEAGELWLRGPNVFGGYWNRPEANVESFVDGWFRTGDLVEQDADGFLYVVGRLKEMFKSGGLNVYPAEIENLLEQHPAVREACVIGVPDAKWNEVGRAVVALKPGAKATEADLVAWCEGKLAHFKMPKSFVFVEALPRNTLGKINRAEVKTAYG